VDNMARTIEQMVDILISFGFGMFMISLSVGVFVVCAWIITHWNSVITCA